MRRKSVFIKRTVRAYYNEHRGKQYCHEDCEYYCSEDGTCDLYGKLKEDTSLRVRNSTDESLLEDYFDFRHKGCIKSEVRKKEE